MKLTIELPDEIVTAAVKAAYADMMESSQLLTIQQAADMLHVSKPTARAIIGEVIDMGASSPRIELRKVKQIIEQRRVPA
jgi:hypothetical protein